MADGNRGRHPPSPDGYPIDPLDQLQEYGCETSQAAAIRLIAKRLKEAERKIETIARELSQARLENTDLTGGR